MGEKKKFEYEICFEIPKRINLKYMIDYLSDKGYNPVFSHHESRLSGTLSLDKKLKQEDYDTIESAPLLSIKPIE